MWSENQLGALLHCLPLPGSSVLARGDCEQLLGMLRVDDQPPSYAGGHAMTVVGLVWSDCLQAGMVIA